MYSRLVEAERQDKAVLWFPAGVAIVLSLIVSRFPWAIRHPDLARTYLSPEAKAVMFTISGTMMVGFVVWTLVNVAVGLRLLSSVYGRATARGVVLTTPWRVLGHPRHRIRLSPGEVQIRLVNEPSTAPMYSHGVQRISIALWGDVAWIPLTATGLGRSTWCGGLW